MKIAVDFDGTIVEHKYPEIGEEMLFAFDTLKELQKQGHQLIMWTFRAGDELLDAVEYCRERGVEFFAVNKSYPEEIFDPEHISRKVDADLFIDDRNFGGFPGWSEIWKKMNPEMYEEEELDDEDIVLKKSAKKQGRGLKKFFK